MKCDKCQAETFADQMLRNDLELVSGPPNGEFFKSMGVAALLDRDPPLLITNWLCKECFRKAYRNQSLGCLVAFSIGLGLAVLFVVSLIAFGKWDSPMQRVAGGTIALTILLTLFVLMWFVSVRRYRQLKPTLADKMSIFGPFYTASLKALAARLAQAPQRGQRLSSEAAIDQQAAFFQQLRFKVIGVEEAKAASRKTDEIRGELAEDPMFRNWVDFLLEIYAWQPEGFVRGSGDSAEKQIRDLGSRLSDLGGKELMLAVHADFALRCPYPGAARNLESMWDGIGTWLG